MGQRNVKIVKEMDHIMSTPTEANIHPMQYALSIEHILIKILHQVITGTEKNKTKAERLAMLELRLVSQQWDLLVSKIIRDSNQFYRRAIDDSSQLKRVSGIMKHAVNPIQDKFRISGKAFDNCKHCYTFFKTCGWFIKDLQINFSYGILKEPLLFSEKSLAAIELPKLERFVYEYSTPHTPFKESDEVKVHLLFAAIITASSSTLKDVDFQFYADDTTIFYSHLKFPPKILTNPDLKWKSLERVRLSVDLNDEFLEDLTRSSMRPKELTLSLHGGGTKFKSENLTQYFALQSTTLVKLNVMEQSKGFVIKFPPKMTALRGVHFNDAYGPTPYVRFEDFDYEIHLPGLETVKLSTVSEEIDWLPFFSSKSDSMKSIHLPIIKFTNLDLAWKLHKIFPNLIELCIGLLPHLKYQKILETVFGTMHQLKSLRIYGVLRDKRVWIDHILTGYPIGDCRRMRRERLFLNPASIQGIPRKPSLVDLTVLEYFQLTCQPALDFLRDSTPYSISDVTGYFSFLQMPNMKKIKFINRGLTETCLNLMRENMDIEIEVIRGYDETEVKRMPIIRPFTYDDYDSPTPPSYGSGHQHFEEGDDTP